jgi:aryl carrier-like protein
MSDLWKQIHELPAEKRELLEKLLRAEGLAPGPVAAEEDTPPRTPVEETLARLWREVLEIDRAGIHANFFRLGGDSIHCMQIVARARREGIGVTTQQLFDHPTIAGLAAVAEVLSQAGDGDLAEPFAEADLAPEELERLLREPDAEGIEDVYTLSPGQEGMLFHVLDDPDPTLYRDQGVCTLRGPLDAAAFRRAWERLAARHPALRTSFRWLGLRRPLQVVHRAVELPLEVADWRGTSAAEAEARIEEQLRRDRERPMRLTVAPLFHLTLARAAEDVHHLLWTHHHLVHDAWSLNLLVHELLALYAAETGGPAAPLPPAPSYRAYVAWLKRLDLAAAESWWRGVLRHLPATPLPVDRRGTGAASAAGHEQLERHLTAEATAALSEAARRLELTTATLLQAAWALVLAQAARADEVVFGTVVAGRPQALPGADGMVGLFINTLPLRVAVTPEQPLRSFLAGLHTRVLELRAHEQAPLSRVQAWSGLERGRPLFESVVVVQNVFVGLPAGGPLAIESLRLLGHSNYPLMLRATPGPALRLECLFDTSRIAPRDAARLLDRFEALLAALAERAAHPETPVEHFLTLLAGQESREREEERREWRQASLDRLRRRTS